MSLFLLITNFSFSVCVTWRLLTCSGTGVDDKRNIRGAKVKVGSNW